MGGHQAQEKQKKLKKALKHEQWKRVEEVSSIKRSHEMIVRRKVHIHHLERELAKLSGKMQHAKTVYAHIVNKEREVTLLKRRVQIIAGRLMHLARKHSMRLSAAKHRLFEAQKALSRLRAREIHEERHRTHYL